MATADPGSGPVSLFGVRNKLQNKVNSLRNNGIILHSKKSYLVYQSRNYTF